MRHRLIELGKINFYPRSPCGERPTPEEAKRWNSTISIHALLAESDGPQGCFHFLGGVISIHALLAESDASRAKTIATEVGDFYPRSPCGERQGVHFDNFNLHCVISIHALLAESDQSTNRRQGRQNQISIHALLAESDRRSAGITRRFRYFYPRSPCGERLRRWESRR